ncbi:MAG: amidohydrolase family protein [Proteobacteria bacterium]|nr:amidohydrolase family protein [Pseudomonadota bacterium]
MRAGGSDVEALVGGSGSGVGFNMPAEAIDCHMHIYDSRVPFCAGASLPHPDASVADYQNLQRRLGLTRAVVVAPSAYGADNSVTLDALLEMGASARGVAIISSEITDAELDRLEAGGMCGARFNFNLTPTPSMSELSRLAPRLAERGWLIQIGMRAPRLAAEAAVLKSLPGKLVLEHCAGIPASADFRGDPAYPIVMDLLEGGRGWIKLSGPYLREPSGAPVYPLLGPFIRHLVERAPERLVWGSDWPHPTERIKPDDMALLRLMADWAADASVRNRILVDNPAHLYGFAPMAQSSTSERTMTC